LASLSHGGERGRPGTRALNPPFWGGEKKKKKKKGTKPYSTQFGQWWEKKN